MTEILADSLADPTAPLPPLGQEPLLMARGIHRAFQVGEREIEVLHGVDLDLVAGERVSLMGSSGTGKTTLLNIVGLLDRPTQGLVRIEGEDGWRLSVAERARLRSRKIGFVFQFYHLLPELNALENAMLPGMIAFGRLEYWGRKRELRDRALEMLESFGLSNRLDHRPGQLSGGEQQRVAIARALLLDPPLLIADEPTGNLDTATGERVLELLFEEQSRRGTTLLLVTHDESLAARCERVVRMRDGRIQSDERTTSTS
jgi:lipoprotein-releasing system ATP-binding protein